MTHIDLNQLRTGNVYRARTSHGTIVGEYLGIETSHGDWSILLRHRAGTESLGLDGVLAVSAA